MAINIKSMQSNVIHNKEVGANEECESLITKTHDLGFAIVNSQALFDRALQGLPQKEYHLLFIDRDLWAAIEPVPQVDPYLFDNEPGYHNAMMKALFYVRDTLGEKLNANKLCQLHDIYVDGVIHNSIKKEPFQKGYAPGYRYGLEWNKVSNDAKRELEDEKLILFFKNQKFLELHKSFECLSTYQPISGGNWSVCSRFEDGTELSRVHEKVNALFEKYYQEIEAADSNDARLAAIVNLCRALEIFHVFPDGNGRTILFAMLPKLLIENGFSPAILDKPFTFDSGYHSTKEMVDLLKKGMENYQKVIEQLQSQSQCAFL